MPLKYVGVTGSTHTDLDVLQGKRIDDYCNADSSRYLSTSWKPSQNSLYWKRNLQLKYVVPGRDWQRFKQQPDQIMYGQKFWTKIGEAARKREKTGMAQEKPKLDNARRMRGTYRGDADDEEYKEILKNARRTGKTCGSNLWLQPCRAKDYPIAPRKWLQSRKSHPRRIPKQWKSCTVESHEPTWQRAESLQSKNHEHHIAGKGFTLMSHYNSVHKFIPIPQAMKVPDAKAAVDRWWKKLDTISAWDLENVKSKKEVILEAQRDKNKVHFAALMDICHLKNAELELQLQKYKGRVVLLGDIVKDDSAPMQFHWTGLVCVPDDCCKNNGRYWKINAVSAFSWVKLEDAPR